MRIEQLRHQEVRLAGGLISGGLPSLAAKGGAKNIDLSVESANR